MDLTLYTAINNKDKTANIFLLVNGNTARKFIIDWHEQQSNNFFLLEMFANKYLYKSTS